MGRSSPRTRSSNAILAWSKDHRVEWHYIAPGKPMHYGYVESFNGRMSIGAELGLFSTRRVEVKRF
jgi:transposase InsO family protein